MLGIKVRAIEGHGGRRGKTDRLEGVTIPTRRGSGSSKRRRKVRSNYCGRNANVLLELRDVGLCSRASFAFLGRSDAKFP